MLGYNLNWILAHFIGDFIFQNDWMANGKKKNNWICLVHVITYMIPFLFCAFTWIQLLLIAVQHYAQDRTNIICWFLNTAGKRQFTQPPLAPWGIILVDGTFHLAWIAFVEAYVVY